MDVSWYVCNWFAPSITGVNRLITEKSVGRGSHIVYKLAHPILRLLQLIEYFLWWLMICYESLYQRIIAIATSLSM